MTLHIRILAGPNATAPGTLVASRSDVDGAAHASFVPPNDATAHRAAVAALLRGDRASDAARRYGAMLFNALFPGPVLGLYDAAWRDGERAPWIHIEAEDPSILALPWELLHDGRRDDPAVPRGCLLRLVPGAGSMPITLEPPLYVLVVDTAITPGERRQFARHRSLAPSFRENWVRFERLDAADLALLKRMRNGEARDHPAVHVIGLAALSGIGRTTGTVLLGGAGGEPATASQLAEALASPTVPTVVSLDLRPQFLPSQLELVTDLACELLRRGTSAVVVRIGYAGRLGSDLARRMYQSLAQGQRLDVAVASALRALGRPWHRLREVGAVQCYAGANTTRPMVSVPPLDADARRRLDVAGLWSIVHRYGGWVIAAVSTFAMLIGLRVDLPIAFPVQPTMDGQFNVAIAQVRGVHGDGAIVDDRQLARRLESSLEQDLAAILGEAYAVTIWGPEQVGLVHADDEDVQERNMRERALHIDADVLVNEEVEFNGSATALTVQYFLSPRQLEPDTIDIAGVHRAGSPLQVPGDAFHNPIVADELAASAAHHIEAIAELIAGLDRYLLYDNERALMHFTRVRRAWSDKDGIEAVLLFLGNTHTRLALADTAVDGDTAGDDAATTHFMKAEEYYRDSLQARQGYRRAQLGLAELRLLKSQGTCSRQSSDIAGLRSAMQEFRAVRVVGDDVDETMPLLRSKVALGMGRTAMCLTMAGDERWRSMAMSNLADVIAIHDQGDPATRDLAAEASGFLGLLESSGPSADVESYNRALRYYENAIDLTSRPERKRAFEVRRNQIRTAIERM